MRVATLAALHAAAACSVELPTGRYACAVSADCPSGFVCVENRCHDPARLPCPEGCDDGVACTRDVCRGGSCRHDADDALCDEVAAGRCDAALGCIYSCAADDACSDGNVCTDDRCEGGSCVFRPNQGGCDDGIACNGVDRCAEGSCSVHDAVESTCSGGVDDDCDGAADCADNDCDAACGCPPGHLHQGACGEADSCGHVFGAPADCGCPNAPSACACALPWGGSIQHGDRRTAYAASAPACNVPCASEERSCIDGTLSGSYTQSTCTARSCASCALPWGGAVAHGGSVTAYRSSAPFTPSTCADASEVRSCNDGVLNGSYDLGVCTEDPCTGSPSVGTSCRDGSVYAGVTPATATKMYATPADEGAYPFAWPETYNGYSDQSDGRANTAGLRQFGNYHAVNVCADLVAHQRDDWFLPAPAEWNVLEAGRAAIGGFEREDSIYWTSTECEGPCALYHRIGTTTHFLTGQGLSFPIRCVRSE